MTPEEFWRLVAAYPDKAAALIYVYRLWPRIIRKPAYLDKYTDLDADRLLRQHGSGAYQLRFTDANRGRFSEQYRCIVKLDDPEFPPVVDPGELDLSHPDNRSFVEDLRRRGLLKEEEDMADAPAATAAVKEVVEFSRDVLRQQGAQPKQNEGEMLAKVLGAVGEIYQRAGNQNVDPLAVLEKAKAILAPPASSSDALVQQLMKQNHDLMMELMRSRNPERAAEEKDPLETLDRATKILERVQGRMGGGSGGFDWAGLAQALPGVVQALAGMSALRAAPAAAAPAPAARAEIAPRPEPVPEVVEIGGQQVNIFGLYSVGQKALKAFEGGMAGDDFAEALVTLEDGGEELYEQLRALGKDGLMQSLQVIPQVQQQLATRRAEIEAWIDDFLGYGAEPAEMAPGPAGGAA